MINLGKAVLYFVGDLTGFNAALNKAKGDANQAAANIGKSLNDMGNKLTLGVSMPLAAFGVASIKAASDLNETVSKTERVFDESADEVMAFGETSAKALGMSKNAALGAAATYGNLFRSMGIVTDVSADMSMGLVKLASDLASFNNLDPGEVLEKLRAGLTGESEPLKPLGININEVIIKTKAMELGLYSGKGAIDAAAKAQAVYALMLEQTTLAQGDFARTADGLANSTRSARAQFEDLKASLGERLLPVATKLMQKLSDLLDWFNNLSEGQKDFIVNLGLVAIAAGPVLKFFGGLANLGGKLGWLKSIGSALPAAVKGAKLAGAAAKAAPWAAGSMEAAMSGGAATAAGTGAGILASIKAIGAAIGTFLISPIGLLIGAVALLGVTWHFFGEDAKKTLSMIGQLIAAVAKRIAFDLGKAFTEMGPAITEVWNEILDAITVKLTEVGLSLAEFGVKVRDTVSGVIQWFSNLRDRIYNSILSIINYLSNLGSRFATIGKNIVEGIWTGIKNGWEWLKTNVANSFDSLLAWVKEKLGISSPSSVWAREIGRPQAQGAGIGWAQEFSAQIKRMGDLAIKAPAMIGQRVNRISNQVGTIVYQGKFSQTELAWLDQRSNGLALRAIEEAFGV